MRIKIKNNAVTFRSVAKYDCSQCKYGICELGEYNEILSFRCELLGSFSVDYAPKSCIYKVEQKN